MRVDCINAIGPTDAWVTLDTVLLTNATQLYYDVTAFRQPARLYRLVPVPYSTPSPLRASDLPTSTSATSRPKNIPSRAVRSPTPSSIGTLRR